jgi:hypothetical protein
MDYVRSQDVDIFTINGTKFVEAMSGGISTYTYSRQPAGKNWWSLPQGAQIPDDLTLVADITTPGHWLWEPSRNMPLSRYEAALRTVQPWTGPTKVAEDMVVTYGPPDLTAPTQAVGDSMTLDPKSYRFLLAALDRQIWTMRHSLEDPSLSEDDQSDLTNDLALYELMRKGIADRGPAKIAGGRDVSGQVVILGQDDEGTG